ncbi:MAG: ribonuclease HI [Fusobacteria bacterium]|nr:ribonuclease HI [Fusobacteriota bacterium]
MKKKYYAFYLEESGENGILDSWEKCKETIYKKKSRYKSFIDINDAKNWLDSGAKYKSASEPEYSVCETSKVLERGIYFDAGTGRGIGVEVKVTDEKGENLLDEVVPKDKINDYGNYTAKDGSTNNFGELLGSYIAFKIALKRDVKNIFGDSKLIIDYWSKGIMNKDKLPEETVNLIKMVTNLRTEFEKKGGTIKHVSGDINPADLGFHK